MLFPTAGRLSEIKKNTKGHSLSVACYLHQKCSRIRQMKDLPYGCTPMVIAYLEAGLRFPSRQDAKKHTDMLLGFYIYIYIINSYSIHFQQCTSSELFVNTQDAMSPLTLPVTQHQWVKNNYCGCSTTILRFNSMVSHDVARLTENVAARSSHID